MGRKRTAANRSAKPRNREASGDSEKSPNAKRARTSRNQPGLGSLTSLAAVAPSGGARDPGPMVQRLPLYSSGFPQVALNGQAPFVYYPSMNGSQIAANSPMDQPRLTFSGIGKPTNTWPGALPEDKKKAAPRASKSKPPRNPSGPNNRRLFTSAPLSLGPGTTPSGQAGHTKSSPAQPPPFGPKALDLVPPPPSSSALAVNKDVNRNGGSKRGLTISRNGSPIRDSQEPGDDVSEAPASNFKKARQVPVKKNNTKKQPVGKAAAKKDETSRVSSDKKDTGYQLRPRRAAVNYTIPMDVDGSHESSENNESGDSEDTMDVDIAVKNSQKRASQPATKSCADTTMEASTPPKAQAAPQTPTAGVSRYSSSSDSSAESAYPSSDSDDEVSGMVNLNITDNNSLGNINPAAADMFQAAFDEAIGVPLPQTPNPRSGQFGLFEGLPASHGLPGLISSLEETNRAEFRLMTNQVEGEPEDQVEYSRNNPFKTDVNFRHWFTNLIKQMMYVSGETGEPSVETTGIIEDIVRQQVVEIVSI